MVKTSVSIENFIKTIYQSEHRVGNTRPGTIAGILGISNAAATDMSRKLAERKLLYYEKYQQLRLTPEGNKMALALIRKHRLWETFLHKTLRLSLHEIHKEAEMLEHQTSDFLAEKINAFLNNPAYDPHGDPIPDINGEFNNNKDSIVLSEAEPDKEYEIIRLFSSEKDFFDFCGNHNIKVGSVIKLEKQYKNSNMTEIRIDNKKLVLNKDLSSIIYIKPIKLN